METATLSRQTYNLTEVAALLGLSDRYVYDLARQGRLTGVIKFGNRWLLPRSKLDHLLENGLGELVEA